LTITAATMRSVPIPLKSLTTSRAKIVTKSKSWCTRYPSISFASASTSAGQLSEGRFQVDMNGTLSLHGVTGKVPVTAQVTLIGGAPSQPIGAILAWTVTFLKTA